MHVYNARFYFFFEIDRFLLFHHQRIYPNNFPFPTIWCNLNYISFNNLIATRINASKIVFHYLGIEEYDYYAIIWEVKIVFDNNTHIARVL